jgi:hypothetical protein
MEQRVGKSKTPDSEVSEMYIKSDLLTGLFIGVIVGLVFTSQLAPHLAVLVILAVVFGTKMIDIK